MAKSSPGGSKDYGSNEPVPPDEGYEPPGGDDAAKDPAGELKKKQLALTALKASEKRLQEEIARLTSHTTAFTALAGQLTDTAIGAVASARADLRKFVDSGKKALDPGTQKIIENEWGAAEAAIKSAVTSYQAKTDERKSRQAALADSQQKVTEAAAAYAAAKDVMARTSKASSELITLREKVEGHVKRDEFAAAGVWLFELDAQLAASPAPNKDKAIAAISDAWRALEKANQNLVTAEDALADATAAEADAKKTLEEAQKQRLVTILEAVNQSAKPASAA